MELLDIITIYVRFFFSTNIYFFFFFGGITTTLFGTISISLKQFHWAKMIHINRYSLDDRRLDIYETLKIRQRVRFHFVVTDEKEHRICFPV